MCNISACYVRKTMCTTTGHYCKTHWDQASAQPVWSEQKDDVSEEPAETDQSPRERRACAAEARLRAASWRG